MQVRDRLAGGGLGGDGLKECDGDSGGGSGVPPPVTARLRHTWQRAGEIFVSNRAEFSYLVIQVPVSLCQQASRGDDVWELTSTEACSIFEEFVLLLTGVIINPLLHIHCTWVSGRNFKAGSCWVAS